MPTIDLEAGASFFSSTCCSGGFSVSISGMFLLLMCIPSLKSSITCVREKSHPRPQTYTRPPFSSCTCITILVPRLSYSRRQILRYGDAGGQGTSTDTSRCAAGTTRGVRSREREDGEAAAALLRLPRDEKGQGRMRGGKRGGELCRSDRSSQGVPQKAWVQSLGPCNCILLSASIYITTVIL